MLGDCYAAAVVEVLSKKELMAADAIMQESSEYDERNSLPNSISKELAPGDIVIRDEKRNGTSKL